MEISEYMHFNAVAWSKAQSLLAPCEILAYHLFFYFDYGCFHTLVDFVRTKG